MIREDAIEYPKFLSKNYELLKNECKTIMIHSSLREEVTIFNKIFNSPPVEITTINKNQWDLYNPSPKKVDLIFMANVMICIAEPAKAFSNIFSACKFVIIKDSIIRHRGLNPDVELHTDGDSMRYSYGTHKAKYEKAFNLDVYQDRAIDFKPYVDNGHKTTNLAFLILMRGDL